MFTFDVEKDKFGLKPMNCPGHWYGRVKSFTRRGNILLQIFYSIIVIFWMYY